MSNVIVDGYNFTETILDQLKSTKPWQIMKNPALYIFTKHVYAINLVLYYTFTLDY